MNTPVSVQGALTLTGRTAQLDIVGRGSRVEVHVKRWRDVPALMLATLRSPAPGSPLTILARAMSAADVHIEVVRGRWRPVDLVAQLPGEGRLGAPRLRPVFHLTRRSSAPAG